MYSFFFLTLRKFSIKSLLAYFAKFAIALDSKTNSIIFVFLTYKNVFIGKKFILIINGNTLQHRNRKTLYKSIDTPYNDPFSIFMSSINDWEATVEDLVEEEAQAKWRPYSDRYINTRFIHEVGIPQISTKNPTIQIICKMTEYLSGMDQYEFDDESLPPKVFCWNDISTIDSKTATKTVRAGLEKEYKRLIQSFNITFQPVSVGNQEPLPVNEKSYQQLIYHILDPTLTQNQKMQPSISSLSVKKLSTSSTRLNELAKKSPKISTVTPVPITEDPDALRKLCTQIENNTIFIIDCNYAQRVANVLLQQIPDLIIFGATRETLRYTPQLPCDLFTSCMLTPSRVALLWQSQDYADIKSGVLTNIEIQNLIDLLNDAKVGNPIIDMLDTCLQSCVDQMIFKVLEETPEKFYKLFRSTPIMLKLCTNFIFASRVLKSFSMTPFSSPTFPDLSLHPLWDSFDVHVDEALYGLHEAIKPTPRAIISEETVLQEQLTTLENWLCFPQEKRTPPSEFQYIAPLLRIPKFFTKTIHLCSMFLRISRAFVVAFLSTTAFSTLTEIINDKEKVSAMSNETATDISYVILNCLLISPQLKKYFENHVDFWIDRLDTGFHELSIVSLSCLLLFSSSPDKIEMYKEEKINETIEKLLDSNSIRQKTIAHILLAKMHQKSTLDVNNYSKESSPLIRAAMITRIRTTLESRKLEKDKEHEIFMTLIESCNDLDALVREESLIALSYLIKQNPEPYLDQIGSKMEELLMPDHFSVSTVLCYQIITMTFDPSNRIAERLCEFINFLSNMKEGKQADPLVSNISSALLSRVAKSISLAAEPLAFSERVMETETQKLVGFPSISPSGLLCCGDSSGVLHCQLTTNVNKGHKVYDFFRPHIDYNNVNDTLKPLFESRNKYSEEIIFSDFIDDFHIFSVSSRSQAIVVDINSPNDPSSSFWMAHPDINKKVIVDYNNRAYKVLHYVNSSYVSIYDLETLRKCQTISIPFAETSNIEWLKPYSTLFYVAQEDLCIYDTRMQEKAAELKGVGSGILSCNASGASPFDLIAGYTSGNVSLIDMRTMTEDACYNIETPLKQFDVHKHLPYSVGLSNDSLISFSAESGILEPKFHRLTKLPNAFALHPNENSCAVRVGNTVKCILIDYDVAE